MGEAENESKAPSESSGSRPHLPANPTPRAVSSCQAPRRPPPTHPSALCSWDLEGQPRMRQMVKEAWGVLFAVFLFVSLIIQVKSEYIFVKKTILLKFPSKQQTNKKPTFLLALESSVGHFPVLASWSPLYQVLVSICSELSRF